MNWWRNRRSPMLCRMPGSGGPCGRSRACTSDAPAARTGRIRAKRCSVTDSVDIRRVWRRRDGPYLVVPLVGPGSVPTERRDGDDLVLGQWAELLHGAGELGSTALVAAHGDRPLHTPPIEHGGRSLS